MTISLMPSTSHIPVASAILKGPGHRPGTITAVAEIWEGIRRKCIVRPERGFRAGVLRYCRLESTRLKGVAEKGNRAKNASAQNSTQTELRIFPEYLPGFRPRLCISDEWYFAQGFQRFGPGLSNIFQFRLPMSCNVKMPVWHSPPRPQAELLRLARAKLVRINFKCLSARGYVACWTQY
ncbi:hypothetical protein P152DRAFT_5214 [Eremomyces bilateralis CBS 781.70]|uniref:Uncharacterized protein n=1 Tax=Eremomyces bilateralis CBS 781.70 TaxID=1392243 RepID=A0A6G1GFZ1_9PEZI|nr:uncharacterized protein P152DRAFT_5214 [Eremomyces bilateralis CBS 781.70]KAF1816973.1 hypothetical protein P152DRAFT_5214 [Eremomyces bilateralis CBS 781.70]